MKVIGGTQYDTDPNAIGERLFIVTMTAAEYAAINGPNISKTIRALEESIATIKGAFPITAQEAKA